MRELLRGAANVHRIPDNAGTTGRGLVMLDEWLGTGRWDVIHFNFGLHDNGGEPRTMPEDYEANLRRLVARLQKTGARLVFSTTTPVPEGDLRPPRRSADAVACNKAARRVMAELGVRVNDLYALALPRLSDLQQPANVHFHAGGIPGPG